MIQYYCHACGERFAAAAADEDGTYAFTRCPACGSASTTLARTGDREG